MGKRDGPVHGCNKGIKLCFCNGEIIGTKKELQIDSKLGLKEDQRFPLIDQRMEK